MRLIRHKAGFEAAHSQYRGAFQIVGMILVLILFAAWQTGVRRQAARDSIQERIIREMSGLPFVPQVTCALSPTPDEAQEAYVQARAETLAHALAAPEAQVLGAPDMLALFSEGVAIATGTQDGAFVVDEQAGFLLVGMKLPVCQHRHKYVYLPMLYVFSRTGDYWTLGAGVFQNMVWTQHRWIGMLQLPIEEGALRYAFVHVV